VNRILFEPEEVADGVATCADARAEHIIKILHGEIGQTLKTGIVNGPIGSGVITSVGSGRVTVAVSHDSESLRPWCDLILAPPRPRVMKRLLPQLAALGVGTIVLVGAQKTEKDFWGATMLRPENIRPLLLDGLMQAGTSILPELVIRRNFRKFLRDELDALFPTPNRIVAHPYLASAASCESASRPLFAVGPEGGWTDEEVSLLAAHGFRGLSLGARILRTDTALVALLSRFLPE